MMDLMYRRHRRTTRYGNVLLTKDAVEGKGSLLLPEGEPSLPAPKKAPKKRRGASVTA